MNIAYRWKVILAFLAAVIVATVWGAIVQTQFNLAALSGIGADIGVGTNLRTTFTDVFSGFSPTYGGYVVAPALLVAFICAGLVVRRTATTPWPWFALAGGLAILFGIPLVNFLSPLALVVGATRDLLCTVLMALGGVPAGLLFAWILADDFHSAPRAVRVT